MPIKIVQTGRKPVAALLALLTLTAYQNAMAAQATGTASASILAPVTVTKIDDLNFGKIIAGSSASSVILGPSGQFRCGNGLTCLDTHSAARFNVAGTPGQTVSIQADDQITLSSPGGARMPVSLELSAKSMKLSAGGGSSNVVTVGGTLTVAAYQAEGTYTGTFSVTVDYN